MKTITVSAQKDFLERLIPKAGTVEADEPEEETDEPEVTQ